MRRANSLHVRGERGFTLPELLVAIVLGALIVAAMTEGILVFLRTDAATADRLARSHDRQQLVQYFSTDVRSASAVVPSVATGSCSGQSADIELSWSEKTDPNPAAPSVGYVVDYGRDPSNVLTRWYCVSGAMKEKQSLARNLTSATTPTSGVVPYLNGMSASLTVVTPEGDAFPVTATRVAGSPVASPVGVPPSQVADLWHASAMSGVTTTTTLSPTTTTAPTTTTTLIVSPTPTTTTTDAPSCTGALAMPNSLSTSGNSGNLSSGFTASITPTGQCSGLTLVFFPDASQAQGAMSLQSGTWSYNEGKSGHSWSNGQKTFTVVDARGRTVAQKQVTVS